MSLFWLLVIVVAALVLVIVKWVVLRRMDGDGTCEPEPEEHFEVAEEEIDRILNRYGKRSPNPHTSRRHAPVHESFRNLMRDYDAIAFDADFKAFDRYLAERPYSCNTEYVQIADWGEGSPLLIRLQADDPNVYLEDIEECEPGKPQLYARSLGEYLVKMEREFSEINVCRSCGYNLTGNGSGRCSECGTPTG